MEVAPSSFPLAKAAGFVSDPSFRAQADFQHLLSSRVLFISRRLLKGTSNYTLDRAQIQFWVGWKVPEALRGPRPSTRGEHGAACRDVRAEGRRRRGRSRGRVGRERETGAPGVRGRVPLRGLSSAASPLLTDRISNLTSFIPFAARRCLFGVSGCLL